jgi:hypothetical protein
MMVQLRKPANAPGNDEKLSFTILENGWYNVIVLDSCEKEYSDNQPGKRTEYKTQVYDGKDQGKLLFIGYNLEHSNPKTEESAHRAHNSFVEKCGKGEIKYTEELHNCLVRVRVVTNKEGFNDVKEYDYYQQSSGQYVVPQQQYQPPIVQQQYQPPVSQQYQPPVPLQQGQTPQYQPPVSQQQGQSQSPQQNYQPSAQSQIPKFVQEHMNAQQPNQGYPTENGQYPGQSQQVPRYDHTNQHDLPPHLRK